MLRYMFISIIGLMTVAVTAHAQPTQAKNPTFVFVHGAHLTSSIWGPVQSHLQKQDYNVVTLDVPSRAQDGVAAKDATLDLAAAKVCQVIGLQPSPVILVGHSQGGAIISHAVGRCSERITGLVYIAAVVPSPGTSAFEDLSKEDEEWFSKCASLDTSKKLWVLSPNAPLHEAFMADVSRDFANIYQAFFVNEPSLIGDGIVQYDQEIFKAIPKIYIETTEDRIITIATQRRIQSKQNLKNIFSLKSSHSPFFSQPASLASILINSANEIENSYNLKTKWSKK